MLKVQLLSSVGKFNSNSRLRIFKESSYYSDSQCLERIFFRIIHFMVVCTVSYIDLYHQ